MGMSPQEKKALSLSRDRRNDYGENDKASRKSLPLARARSHRALRREDKAALRDSEAAVETVPLRLRKPKWRKWPDIALSLMLERQIRRRRRLDAARPE
jgi:hypothetical protein